MPHLNQPPTSYPLPPPKKKCDFCIFFRFIIFSTVVSSKILININIFCVSLNSGQTFVPKPTKDSLFLLYSIIKNQYIHFLSFRKQLKKKKCVFMYFLYFFYIERGSQVLIMKFYILWIFLKKSIKDINVQILYVQSIFSCYLQQFFT